ncbi:MULTISPECIES: hypothetical protein [unclassified Microcoleus]|uniref:hypothetical protein n=1 Tax=unclassified Microcoleus TaxID=2642155 RepID=UPI002FD5C440
MAGRELTKIIVRSIAAQWDDRTLQHLSPLTHPTRVSVIVGCVSGRTMPATYSSIFPR